MKNPELWVVAKTATGGMEGVRKFWMLDFELWILGWGEEKPNGEFWMLNGGLVKFERRNGKLAFGRCWNEEGC